VNVENGEAECMYDTFFSSSYSSSSFSFSFIFSSFSLPYNPFSFPSHEKTTKSRKENPDSWLNFCVRFKLRILGKQLKLA
jgi:hypothetical protein